VWYCDAEGTTHVSREDLTECPQCRGPLRRDPDVLDTWFSSQLWPFSTLGWPRETPELKTFYPTACLVTGFDILFFWVARMIMIGLHVMNEVPFRDTYIHALVRDMEGQKMSKSKGNVIDPLAVMDQYGTDALRFTLAALAAQGRDIRLSNERIEGYRNFANKVWNAARFVLTNLDGYRPGRRKAPPALADRWIVTRLHQTVADVRRALAAYRFNDAAGAIYHFLWHDYCDWYIEWSKLTLYRSEDPGARARTQATLVEVLEATLRLLHPFMPFLTEEIWQRLPKGPRAPESVMIARYPRASRRKADAGALAEVAPVMSVVAAVRTLRSEMQIPPARPLTVVVRPPGEGVVAGILRENVAAIGALARAEVRIDPDAARPPHSAIKVTESGEVYVPLEGVLDLAEERARLGRELAKVEVEIGRLEAKLGRAEFRERAPAEVVAREETRRDEQRGLATKLREAIERLDALGAARG
jgi:valyl-tRNA synthetase